MERFVLLQIRNVYCDLSLPLYACIGTGDGESVPAASIEEKFARHGTGLGCLYAIVNF